MRRGQNIFVLVVIVLLSVYLYTQRPQNKLSPEENKSEEVDLRLVLAPHDENDFEGYYNLGDDYREGKKVKQDYVKAMENFKHSCDLKYGLACLDVATMYSNGTGVAQSRDKASEYFEKACDYGYAGGCKNWNIMNGYAPEVPNISQK